MNDHPVSKVGKLFTRRIKSLPTAEIAHGNIFKSFEKIVTTHLESKTG
jgi:hypothetical protein